MQQTFTASDYGGIVLSAGGLKGFYELGVLQYYHEQGYLANAKVYAGTSIGSVLAAFYSAGFDPAEILTKFLEIEILDTRDADWSNIAKDYGIYSTDRLRHYLERAFRGKFGYVPTLLELFQLTKHHLILCAYNVTKSRTEYFSWKTEPNMPVTDAIVASCTIPTLFKAFHYRGSIYVDGARGEVCPLDYTRRYMQEYTDHRLLCVTFDEREPQNWMEFMNNVVVNWNVKREHIPKYKETTDIVFLDNEWVPFDAPYEKKVEMYNAGYKFIKALAEKQIEQISQQMPVADNILNSRENREQKELVKRH